MQQRNLIFFVVLSITLMGAWYWFLAPTDLGKTTDPDKKDLAQNKGDLNPKEDAKDKDKDKKPPEKKEEKKPPEIKKDPEPKEKPPEKKEEPAQKETIGGDGFHLTVVLTTRGAGVRSVVLNRFKAADWRGRPTEPARDLELIPDNEYTPSFRMYHYVQKEPVFGLGEKIWRLEGKTKNDDLAEEVRFSTTVPEFDYIKIVKIYRIKPKDYHVTLLMEFHDLRKDRTEKATEFRYQLTGGWGLPIEGEWYTTIYRNAFMGLVDPRNSLYRKQEESSRISGRKGGDRFPEGSRGDNRMQYAGVANQFFGSMIVVDDVQPDKKDGGVAPGDIIAWARPTLETTEKRGIIRKFRDGKNRMEFIDDKGEPAEYTLLPHTRQHFDDLDLAEGQQITLSWYKTPEGKRIATWARLGTAARPQFDDITVRVTSEAIELTPNAVVKHQFILYHGPVKAALLGQFTGDKEVPEETVKRYTHTLHLRSLTDYASDNWFGWISSKIMLTDLIIIVTRFMHWLLNLLHYVFGYGLSIVVLTVMVRGAMFPISRRQALFSIKMQEMAPELKKVQEKYADDPQAKMQATQEFYRKNGINPLGSCWPVFLQMPIFLGLYFALQESIHFRLANFLWIENLAAPDMIFEWGTAIPYISNPDNLGGMLYLGPFLNILPMVAVVFMMVQQIQTMPPPTDEQQAMQQKMLKFMTIFFGIMFYKVAAGLCIYFIASSLWGMAERKLLPKKKLGLPESSVPGLGNKTMPDAKALAPQKGKGKNWKKDKDKDKARDDQPVTALGKLKALWHEILRQAEKK